PHHDLQSDLWPTILLCFQAGHGGHVSSHAVSDNSQARAIDVDFIPMFRNPFRRCINFIYCNRIPGVRSRSIVDKYGGGAGAHDQVSDHALMRREVSQYPSSTVDEHENGKSACFPFWSYDVELYRVSIAGDSFFCNLDAG